jgi:hypothetical protein
MFLLRLVQSIQGDIRSSLYYFKEKVVVMKHLFLVLTLIIVLTSFLTACSDKVISSFLEATTGTYIDPPPTQDTLNHSDLLEDFVNAINNHQIAETVDLFDESANLVGIDQINYGLTLDGTYSYSGKAEIEGWVEYQSERIIKIVPQENKVSSDSLDVIFYYPGHVEYVTMEAQTQGGKFKSLYYYIEKIE